MRTQTTRFGLRGRASAIVVLTLTLVLFLAGCGGSGGGGIMSAKTGTMDDGLTSGTLFGQVTDPATGAGVSNISVTLTRSGDVSTAAAKTASATSTASTEVSIDADGNYSSPSLLAGHYVIRATRFGFDSVTAQVDVPGGQNVRYDFTMSTSSGTTGVRGILRDAQGHVVKGASITLASSTARSAKAHKTASTTTNDAGFYILTNLDVGTYVVTITHPDLATKIFLVTLKLGQMEQFSLLMQPGDPKGTGNIFGFVRDSRGNPIARANVSLDYTILRGKGKQAKIASASTSATSTTTGFTQTDENGFYVFTSVPAGAYVVRAEAPNYLANSVTVSVAAGQNVNADIVLNFRLVYNGKADYFLGIWGSSTRNVYAVGALGAIKHYDGDKWTYQSSNTGENLFSVWGTADGKLVLAVGNSNVVVRSTDGGATWTPSGAGIGASCHAVWGTPDGAAIYLISPFGGLFKSVDGGLTWTAGTYTTDSLPVPRSATSLNQICGMPDGSAVFVTGYNGTIYRSIDGGTTWESLATGSTESLKHMQCWTDGSGKHVLASGDRSNLVARSDDNGNTWSTYTLPAINTSRGLYEQRGLWGLSDGSAMYLLSTQYICRSTDGGRTWTTVGDADVLDYCLWVGLDPESGENIFQGAGEGRIWQATEAGALWSIVNQGDVWSLYSVLAFTATEICAIGETNPSSVKSGFYTVGLHGDATHELAAANVYALALRSIWGQSQSMLFAAAADKGICNSVDRGATWKQWLVADGDYISGLAGGAASAPMVGVGYELASDKGLVLYQSLDQTWHTVKLTVGLHLRAVTQIPGQDSYVAVGEAGQVILPTDSTLAQWVQANVNGVKDNLYAVCSAGATLYACGDNGTLLTSTDGGKNWTKTTIGVGPLYGIWGSSSSDIFVVGLENYHYDGTSWTKMTAENEGTIQTDKFLSVGVSGSPDNSKVYAVGLGGRIYVYER